jgi:hypothetical protein
MWHVMHLPYCFALHISAPTTDVTTYHNNTTLHQQDHRLLPPLRRELFRAGLLFIGTVSKHARKKQGAALTISRERAREKEKLALSPTISVFCLPDRVKMVAGYCHAHVGIMRWILSPGHMRMVPTKNPAGPNEVVRIETMRLTPP